MQIARGQLEEEAGRLLKRRDDVMRRLAQLGEDIRREEQLMADNTQVLSRLDEEEAELTELLAQSGEEAEETRLLFEEAAARLAKSEEALPLSPPSAPDWWRRRRSWNAAFATH